MKLWIARDENGQLWLFDKPPVLRDEKVEDTNHSWFDMSEDGEYNYMLGGYELFPEVTFENSPQKVELKLVNNTTNGFAEDLLTNCKPLEGEFSKFVDNNFDNLI